MKATQGQQLDLNLEIPTAAPERKAHREERLQHEYNQQIFFGRLEKMAMILNDTEGEGK